jgi:hypothetical protein
MGQPSPPSVGVTCAQQLCGNGAFKPGDPWQANSFAYIGILATGDFDFEVPGLTNPTSTASGSPGAFDGSYVLAHRNLSGVTAGFLGTSGISGEVSWGAARKSFGVTMAAAYASNSEGSGIWGAPWKHDEWISDASPDNADALLLFHNGSMRDDRDPFLLFISYCGSTQNCGPPTGNMGDCDTFLPAANVRRGDLSCGVSALLIRAATSGPFKRSRDWPDGSWGCVRGEYTNMGSPNFGMKIWFQGPGMADEILVIDFDGVDDRILQSRDGYRGFIFNTYANANQQLPGERPTIETTYRYEDNIHVRAGEPVRCSQIGYK